MADGILKSNPDEIWNYFVSVNRNQEHIDQAIQEVYQAFSHLEDRLEKKGRVILDKLNDLEKRLQILNDELSRTEEKDRREQLQAEISAVRTEIAKWQEVYELLRRASRQIPEYLERIASERKSCVASFTRGRRVLNAYLKLTEVHAACEGFQECAAGSTPGRYGMMQYRGTTFYCDNEAFDPQAKDEKGRTNLERMACGIAPIGHDGQSVELHHLIQSESGSIAEVSGSMHRGAHKALHINTSDIPSGINRPSFDVLRAAYWQKRAQLLGGAIPQ